MSGANVYFNNKNYYIRKLKFSDINENYLSWFKDKNNTKFIKVSSIKGLKDLKEYYKKQNKKNYFLGIFESITNRHIGNIKFEKIDFKKKTAFVGIFLGDTKYQNKGIGSIALITACNLVFSKFKLFKIFLKVNKKNITAIKSYKKSGFYIYSLKKNNITMIRNYFYNKIVIGTANFENDYGIVKKKKISKIDKNQIYKVCEKFNISSYDLSDAYNLNFKIINQVISKNSSIYLKLFNSLDSKSLKKLIFFQNLFKKKLKFLIVHGYNKVLDLNKRRKIKNLLKLSKYLPLGISIYSPAELYKSKKLLQFKYIQAPVNIFDQRFLSKNITNFLNRNNIFFCARSIYLKGLLLQNKKFIKKKYPKYYRDFENFFDHSSKDYKERKKLLAHFVFQNKNIDKVVVGFDNCKQLKDLIKVLDNNFNLNYKQISSFKKKIST